MLAQALRDHGYATYRANLSALLNIPATASEIEVCQTVQAGFPAKQLACMASTGQISPSDRDAIIPLRTLKARLDKGQNLTTEESDKLFRLSHIRAMANAVFGNEEKAQRWLSKPKARFEGLTPINMIATAPGFRLVEEMLLQVAEGYSF